MQCSALLFFLCLHLDAAKLNYLIKCHNNEFVKIKLFAKMLLLIIR